MKHLCFLASDQAMLTENCINLVIPPSACPRPTRTLFAPRSIVAVSVLTLKVPVTLSRFELARAATGALVSFWHAVFSCYSDHPHPVGYWKAKLSTVSVRLSSVVAALRRYVRCEWARQIESSCHGSSEKRYLSSGSHLCCSVSAFLPNLYAEIPRGFAGSRFFAVLRI